MTSPFALGLERNRANHRPLTPLSLLDRAADAWDRRDRRDAELFGALTSDAVMQRRIMAALFSYHDRWSTRRRRLVNAVKYTCLFFGLNILDFVITNL